MYGSRIQRRPGSKREVRENYDRSLSGSQAYTPQSEECRYSKPSQKAASRQELERFCICRPRPCLRHVWRVTLTRQFAVGQTLACVRHCLNEPRRRSDLVPEGVLPIVEAERLLIHVPEKDRKARLPRRCRSTRASTDSRSSCRCRSARPPFRCFRIEGKKPLRGRPSIVRPIPLDPNSCHV